MSTTHTLYICEVVKATYAQTGLFVHLVRSAPSGVKSTVNPHSIVRAPSTHNSVLVYRVHIY